MSKFIITNISTGAFIRKDAITAVISTVHHHSMWLSKIFYGNDDEWIASTKTPKDILKELDNA